MISYEPFFKTLKEKGLKLIDVERGCKFSSRTINNISNGKYVNLRTIDRICEFLDVPIEKIVEYRRE